MSTLPVCPAGGRMSRGDRRGSFTSLPTAPASLGAAFAEPTSVRTARCTGSASEECRQTDGEHLADLRVTAEPESLDHLGLCEASGEQKGRHSRVQCER